jgi:hypothetical protein
MAHSLSWIDTDELNALFEVLGARRGQSAAKPSPESQIAADSWELGARRPTSRRARATEPQPAAEDLLSPPATAPTRAARSVVRAASSSPAVAAAPRGPRIEPFRPDASASLATRMEQFFDWALGQAPVLGAVIADNQGLVVGRRQAGELEAALAISMEQLCGRVSALFADEPTEKKAEVAGHVVLRHKGRLLITVWTPTDYGRYYGVLIGRSVPGAELLELAGQGLATVFAG